MKKLYTLIACTTLFVSANAQTDAQIAALTHNEAKLATIDVLPRVGPPAQKMAVSCDSLTTITTGGNGYNGNMFDMTVTANTTLETFSVSMDAGTWMVAIYYRTGTYVGSETSSAGWTFLDSAAITSTVTDGSTLYKVPVNVNLPLMAGNTYGFYVTGTSSASPINYTNGTSVGTVVASNANFSIKEGHGGAYPFNLVNSPRIFNGQAFFCSGIAGVDEAEMSMFDIYPNPATENVSINLEKFNGQNISLSITNALGQVVESSTFKASGTTSLDIQKYSSGLYSVQVIAGDKAYRSKFIKK